MFKERIYDIEQNNKTLEVRIRVGYYYLPYKNTAKSYDTVQGNERRLAT